MAEIPLVDLDSGENSADPQITPQLIFLDSPEEVEKINQEVPISPENPRMKPIEKSAEPTITTETGKQQQDSDQYKTEIVRYS